MGKLAKKKESNNRNDISSKFLGWLRGFVLFILGTLFGLYISQWFVTLLPGSKVNAMVQGLRGVSGNTIGCMYYTFTVQSDDPIEYVYMKLQFPSQIENHHVGLPVEAQIAAAGRVNMQVWEMGKNAKGECAIIQAAVNNSTDVQASAAGNMIALHASKLPPKTTIIGAIATTDKKSSVNPAPKLYTEGAYEYTKLGQTIRKTLVISNGGIVDAK